MVDYRRAGLFLFVICAAAALYLQWHRAQDAATVCETGAFLCFAFFILTTEAHENWSFDVYAPLATVVALRDGGSYRRLYVALSTTFLVNLALHDLTLEALAGPTFARPARVLGLLNAAAQCALFLWWGRMLFRVPSRLASNIRQT